MAKEKEKSTIIIKHFVIILNEGLENNFIDALDKLCKEYTENENQYLFDFKVEN